jgi:hypothetical protein
LRSPLPSPRKQCRGGRADHDHRLASPRPFADTDTCSFPITTTVDQTRTTTTFDNGDVKRHVSGPLGATPDNCAILAP